MTPGDVQVFEKKIQISFKKSVDTILALLLQAMLPGLLPAPKFHSHQP
jgi:hypothetical protein